MGGQEHGGFLGGLFGRAVLGFKAAEVSAREQGCLSHEDGGPALGGLVVALLTAGVVSGGLFFGELGQEGIGVKQKSDTADVAETEAGQHPCTQRQRLTYVKGFV